jgi:hypothetical protein
MSSQTLGDLLPAWLLIVPVIFALIDLFSTGSTRVGYRA